MNAADLAAKLAQARAEARVVQIENSSELIVSVDDAYRVQSELAALADGDIRGWKVTALTPQDQSKFSSSRPVAGILLDRYVHRTPATLALSQLVTPLLECEIAFVLGADLPPRSTPYDRCEIEAAVEAVVAAMEVADSRVTASAPDLMKLADSMGNGAFVVGEPVSGWRGLDLTDIAIRLKADNGERQNGNSARILGDPFLALLALANAQPLPAGGLKKGQIITTGTCTTPVKPREGEYVADFGPLGELRVSFVNEPVKI